MKNFISFSPLICLISFLIFALLISCNQPENQQETPNFEAKQAALNLPAMYTGTLPCADCPGINYQLILEDDGFTEFSQYRDRSPVKFEETGTWNINGDTLTLVGQENLILKRFLFDQDSLTLLDRNSQKITGNLADMYVLNRVGDQESIRKHHQDLAVKGFTYFAAGNEPFWSLKIDSLNQLLFETPNRELNVGETVLSEIEDKIQFEASSDSIQIAVQIRREYCQDSMSGYLFPQTVTVLMQTSGVDTLRGCGLFLNR